MIISEPIELQARIDERYDSLAGKGRRLAQFTLSAPDKAVFMTTRQLGAAAGGISEATVVRFVRQLGFDTYAQFISSLRDLIDRKFTLVDRGRMTQPITGEEDLELDWLVRQDITNIKAMQNHVDQNQIKSVCKILSQASGVFVMGARLSYSSAHYMGWTLGKIRDKVSILNGSDRTNMDKMVFAPRGTAIVVISTTRYPNELIRMGKLARRQGFKQILITDSSACPLAGFSDHVLLAPQATIPFLGNPVGLISLIHYLLTSLAADMKDEMKAYQKKLEQAYLENDTWFN